MAVAGQRGQGRYQALDAFRIVAAFMVIAIHTSPLETVNGTADFVLTRALCRLAVPFFFMASGFFMVQGKRPRPLQGMLAKTLKLYGLAMALYLPLNLYMGYFGGQGFLWKLVRDVLFEGTFYHLWYFPAVALGGAIAWLLYKKLPLPAGLAVAALLYMVGLGGDSYYGFVTQLPALKTGYDALLAVFGYTRNGLFFAPLFVLLGMAFARGNATRAGRRQPRRGGLATAFAVALAALVAEALWLRGAGVMRHDSMYIMLPFCMVPLFALLVGRPVADAPAPEMNEAMPVPHPKSRGALLRRFSLVLYLVHPWCIVAVRGAAKAAGLSALVVQNSLVFYVAVCAASAAVGFVACLLPFGGGPVKKAPPRAWAQLDGEALDHNLQEMTALLPEGCRMMAVVKADAYGHGAVWVARRLWRRGVRAFAVATMQEGVRLRRHGVRGTILVLGYTPPEYAWKLWFYRLCQTVVDGQHAGQLSANGPRVRVHVKADTGMHRLGVDAQDFEAVQAIYHLPGIKVEGLYTHLARADSRKAEDVRFTEGQIAAFYTLVQKLKDQGTAPGKLHLQSSYGVLNYPGLTADYARVGIALYGCPAPGAENTREKPQLRPVMAVKARVALVRRLKAGEYLGYGSETCCERDMKMAMLAFGYGDGLPRNLKGGRVLAQGASLPIVGRVCMDQVAVCLDDLPGLAQGDVVTVLGGSGALWVTAGELAEKSGTIANEVFTGIGARVKRMPKRKSAKSEQAQGIPFRLSPQPR